jgi:hypothetical protein
MVRKYLKVVYAAGISLSLLSVLVFVGITGTNQETGTMAYGAMMYDKSNSTSTQGGSMSNNSTTMMTTDEMSMTHRAAVGNIANVQLDSDGKPAWIQSGIWVMRASFAENATEPQSVSLMARFTMVQTDGSARHMHMISGFKPIEFTTEQNDTIHFLNGTATVTMKDGPVSDVPLTIKIFNGAVIGLWIGPDKVDSHFGSDPIYGILSARSMAMMMEMGSMKGEGQMMGNSTGT